MAYDFETRHDYLRTRMREVNSRDVTYTRGTTSGTVSATVYEADPTELQPFGVSLDVRHFFLIVHVTALEALLGDGAEPERDDRIDDSNIGVELRVEPMGDEPPYRFTNHQRKAVRIHAIEVGALESGSSSSS